MIRFKRGKPVYMAAIFAVLLLLWIVFAPIQMGGRVAYVIIDGTSMEPEFSKGDLVMVRHVPYYHRGDIVAYRHPEIGHVFHRIVDITSEGFVLKGDNNFWLDSYFPTKDDVIGKYWFHIPKAGNVVKTLRQPGVFVLVVIGFSIAIIIPTRGKKLIEKPLKKPNLKESKPMVSVSTKTQEIIFLIAVLAFTSLLLGIFAFTQPINRTAEEMLTFQHKGEFSYTADTVPGVYDNLKVQSGEPVFRQITDSITLDFSYKFETELITEIQGKYQLVAEIRDNSGWKRTIKLIAEKEFSDLEFSLNASIDFEDVQRLINFFESKTKVIRTQYILAFIPLVTIEGEYKEQIFNESFKPELRFLFDELQMIMLSDEESNPLFPSQISIHQLQVSEPNTIGIFSLELPVETARVISVIGIGLSLAVTAGHFWNLRQTSKRGLAYRIAKTYSDMIVDVNKKPPKAKRIEVNSIEDLVKLSNLNQNVIMHVAKNGIHHYFANVADKSYYFEVDEDNIDEE
jgi:signal peptidase